MDHYYKQPEYVRNFKCIGGDCPQSCCDGWEVQWKNEEIKKIKNSGRAEEVVGRINDSFVYSDKDKCNIVRMCDDGRCPFHNRETDLCDIQHEMGEEYLGTVCRQYPRQYILSKGRVFKWCSTSCPAVIDLLVQTENALDLENVIARDFNSLDWSTMVVDTEEAVSSDPIRKLRVILFDFYTEMLLNKNRSFEVSVILTALAIKHLTDAETKGRLDDIPKIINDLNKQLNAPTVAKSVDEINPNYQLKFKLVNNMLVKFFGNNSQFINIISALHNGSELIVDNYLTGLNKFTEAYDGKDYILRNIIMNTFLDLNMPLGKLKRPLFENYAYFVLVAASIKTVAAAIGFTSNKIKEDFKMCVAEMSRSFSHDILTADAIAEEIKQMGLNSPAHLALIIK